MTHLFLEFQEDNYTDIMYNLWYTISRLMFIFITTYIITFSLLFYILSSIILYYKKEIKISLNDKQEIQFTYIKSNVSNLDKSN